MAIEKQVDVIWLLGCRDNGKQKVLKSYNLRTYLLAGETGIEPATDGFGDRCSTVEPLPCII